MNQNILVLNCGGSSIKYKLFHFPDEISIAEGSVQGLSGVKGRVTHKVRGESMIVREELISNYQSGLHLLIQHLLNSKLIHTLDSGQPENFVIAHKIAHGGEKVGKVEFIDNKIEKAIADMGVVTSVHNPSMLQAIRAMRVVAPDIPQFAFFETGFHQTNPKCASVYGLPFELAKTYGLRKFGFHGASHQYISQTVPEILKCASGDLRLISIHLGSGTSVAAIKDGCSLDVSSGFTPQSGTIMSTRAGDFDPEVIIYLLAHNLLSLMEIREMLNNQAGLAGISGIAGGDIREIEAAAKNGYPRAKLALEVFCYGIKKYIGAFAVTLQGIDAISFTGGIGEHDPFIRHQICQGMEWLGIHIDTALNDSVLETGIIHQEKSSVKIVVLPTNEELIVAREVAGFSAKQLFNS